VDNFSLLSFTIPNKILIFTPNNNLKHTNNMFKTIKISNQSTDKEIENATYWANYVTLKTGVPVVIELADPSDPDVMEPKFNKDDVAKKPKKKGLQDKSLEELAEEVDSMVERLLMFESEDTKEEEEEEVDIRGVVLDGLSFGDAIWALRRGGTAYRAKWASKGGHFIYQPNGVSVPMKHLHQVMSIPSLVKQTITERADPHSSVDMTNQMCMVHPNNEIFGWTASVSDMNADDWIITHS